MFLFQIHIFTFHRLILVLRIFIFILPILVSALSSLEMLIISYSTLIFFCSCVATVYSELIIISIIIFCCNLSLTRVWSLFRILVSLALYSYFYVNVERRSQLSVFPAVFSGSKPVFASAGSDVNVHRSLLWISSVSPKNKAFCLEAGVPTWGSGVWAWKGGWKSFSLLNRLFLYPLFGHTSHISTVLGVPSSGIKWFCFVREQISGLQYCGADSFLMVCSKEGNWSSNYSVFTF